ncbi:MAG: hypothetical protein QOE90_902 [Thermoplasmata archaeon]|jgi:glutathione synthase/RimK-type ligase-like ATP-grasp enzyme|nr:hypothetical protein [Thermoplasmata archaeon]
MTAIVFTLERDPYSRRMIEALRARGIPTLGFDLADPSRNGLTLEVDGDRATGTIRTPAGAVDLAEARAFVNHFLVVRPPPVAEHARRFATEEWFSALVALHQLTRDRLWVNPLDAYLLGESKLFQLQVAARAGLATPRSLVSNERAPIEAFAKAHPEGLAVKRVSHPFPRLGEGAAHEWVLYTHRVAPEELRGEALAQAHLAPLAAQAYVEKATEVRAYVVGEAVLACEILSQEDEQTRDDWRRFPRREGGGLDEARWRCRPYALPGAVAARLRDATRAMGLRYAAADLIVTPQGEHVFLEANGMGAFGFAEDLAGLRVSEAFADLVAASLGL